MQRNESPEPDKEVNALNGIMDFTSYYQGKKMFYLLSCDKYSYTFSAKPSGNRLIAAAKMR